MDISVRMREAKSRVRVIRGCGLYAGAGYTRIYIRYLTIFVRSADCI